MVRLAGSTFALVLLIAFALATAAVSCTWPGQRVAQVTPPGCGKDTDCKGARVCVKNACVEPPQKIAVVETPHDGGISDGGGDAALQQNAISLPGASPHFHGDWTHRGRSKFNAPAAQPSEIAKVTASGVVVSSPAIADDGTAYFGSHDRVVRAATTDGNVKWSRATGDLVWCSPALGPGNVVYIGSDDDRLYAFDAADGNIKWTFTAGPCKRALGVGPEAARCDVDGVTIGPDGTIYFVADGAYALAPDGTQKFHFAIQHTHCAGAPAVGPDGTVYVGCQDGALYALAADGNKLWEFRAAGDVDSSPAVAPDGTVYFGSDDKKLYALGPGGALKWAVQTGGDIRSSPAIAADGTVYVGSSDGGLYAVRPTGTVAWTFRAADRILSSPTIDAAGMILFGSQDDRLYAVAPDGKLVWSVLLGGDVDGTPAIGPNGTIYVGADDGALHILK
jgi:outer membrane protein assembly factor BamB